MYITGFLIFTSYIYYIVQFILIPMPNPV